MMLTALHSWFVIALAAQVIGLALLVVGHLVAAVHAWIVAPVPQRPAAPERMYRRPDRQRR